MSIKAKKHNWNPKSAKIRKELVVDGVLHKKCGACDSFHPWTTEFWGGLDKTNSYCKSIYSKRAKDRYNSTKPAPKWPENTIVDGVENKFCKICQIYHPHTAEFWKNKITHETCTVAHNARKIVQNNKKIARKGGPKKREQARVLNFVINGVEYRKCKFCDASEHLFNDDLWYSYINKSSGITSFKCKTKILEKDRARMDALKESDPLAYNTLIDKKTAAKNKFYDKAKSDPVAKDKMLAAAREYKKSDRGKKTSRERRAVRLETDELYKFATKIRRTVREGILRTREFSKNTQAEQILGSSFEEAKVYIELKFDSMMNWKNYGTYWVFDHICPVSQAKTQEEVILLNHFTNFQPLEAKANIYKGDKQTPEGLECCKRLLNRDWV